MNHHDGSSVTDLAYEHIRSRLSRGAYTAGTRLVTRRIARDLGASLNPVREALGRLAAEGLVDHVPGAGSFVRRPQPDEIVQLYEFRLAIEPFVAAKAARVISDLDLRILGGLCEEQHDLVRALRQPPGYLRAEQLEAWLSLEERFHEAIVRAARNDHFIRALNQSRFLAKLFQAHGSLGVRIDLTLAARTWRGHSRLLRALKRRDGDEAAAIVRDALHHGMASVLAAEATATSQDRARP